MTGRAPSDAVVEQGCALVGDALAEGEMDVVGFDVRAPRRVLEDPSLLEGGVGVHEHSDRGPGPVTEQVHSRDVHDDVGTPAELVCIRHAGPEPA